MYYFIKKSDDVSYILDKKLKQKNNNLKSLVIYTKNYHYHIAYFCQNKALLACTLKKPTGRSKT